MEPFMEERLKGRTLGIIGYGGGGETVGNRAAAFGMRVRSREAHSLAAAQVQELHRRCGRRSRSGRRDRAGIFELSEVPVSDRAQVGFAGVDRQYVIGRCVAPVQSSPFAVSLTPVLVFAQRCQ